jgi:hypothetical protein
MPRLGIRPSGDDALGLGVVVEARQAHGVRGGRRAAP